ncbi:G patch domain and ankyrin repeat-containing protein 1 homolog [Tubulanus polymorphus]|uniref:G patch domain and ankyrin repeat-containing protein 1 homolog n=1 Tax=Tubulanus polymorphus TaxID=672921 RepID=UPI003DA631A2
MNSNLRLIDFVRAKLDQIEPDTNDKVNLDGEAISSNQRGSEAKAFYDDVIQSVPQSLAESPRRELKEKSLSVEPEMTKHHTNSNDKKRIFHEFLRFAQNGNLSKLKEVFESGHVEVDTVDIFNWTALMCAACSGALDVVEYLVLSGANPHLRNNQHLTALDLARKANRHAVVQYLENSKCGLIEVDSVVTSLKYELRSDDPFYCETCKMNFIETSRTKHENSTVHLFSSKKFTKMKTMYHLPESNRGFQLMLKSGWNQDSGLGPEGKGQRYPVKTVLKQDRQGLGQSSNLKKARITHFGPYDKMAVKTRKKHREMTVTTLSKKNQKDKEHKRKQWEIRLRTYMNSE